MVHSLVCKTCSIPFKSIYPSKLYCDSCKLKQYPTFSINLKVRFRIFKKFNFTCQYCGRKAPEVPIELDHIFPKSLGGEDREENYTVACKDCNIGKSNSIL